MLPARTGLVIAAGGLGLLGWGFFRGWFDRNLLSPRRKTGRLGALEPTPLEVDSLARLILTESSEEGIGGPEGAGIAYVALNRIKASRGKWTTAEDLVFDRTGKTWFGDTRGKGYCYFTGTYLCPGRTRGDKLVWEHRKWTVAALQASRVLHGKEPNPVGKRTSFVHPGGMPVCAEAGVQKKGRLCSNTAAGLRWMPAWILAAGEGGNAPNEPISVGSAVFAGWR